MDLVARVGVRVEVVLDVLFALAVDFAPVCFVDVCDTLLGVVDLEEGDMPMVVEYKRS